MAASDPRAQIVETLLNQRRKSVRWLAKQLGVSHQAVQNWLDGTNTPRKSDVWDEMIAKLRPTTSPTGISTGSDTVTLYRSPMRLVPIGGSAYAGKPQPGYQDVEWEEVKDWGGEFDRWGKVVSGNSMEDLLEPGDRVIFENRKAESGHVVHALKGDEEVIKVLKGNEFTGQLMSINRECDDQSAEGWEILGVGVMRIRYGVQDTRESVEFPHGMRHRF